MLSRYLNNKTILELFTLEIIQAVEDHKKIKLIRETNKRIRLILFDSNGMESMEYLLTGFLYRRIRRQIRNFREINEGFGKFAEPFPHKSNSGEAGIAENQENNKNF